MLHEAINFNQFREANFKESRLRDFMIIKLGVSGAFGKMGARILTLASQDHDFKVELALERSSHPQIGDKVAGAEVVSSFDRLKNIDVLIDFSSPEGTLEYLRHCLKYKKAIVIGTTGFSPREKELILEAGRKIPIVFSPNMSIGVNILFSLVRQAASQLSPDYGVSMTEAHHIHKKDAPSGTAKFLSEIVKKEREGIEIDIRSIREGEIVGDHEVVFDSPWDTIKISHSAKTRDIFARGALQAAKFITKKKSGLYVMEDVIREYSNDKK